MPNNISTWSRNKAGTAAGVGAAMLAAIALVTPFIVEKEGYESVGYADIIGTATSCVGHTGPDAVVGRRYTKAECESQLAYDLERTAKGIAPCIKVDVPRESLAAFLSFSFNVGPAAFCKSTMARKLNAGDLAGACVELDRWVNAGGRRIQGLVNRRAAERKLCESGLKR